MLNTTRTLTIFFISFLMSRGLLPAEVGEAAKNDPDFLLAIEAAVAAMLTLVAGVVASIAKDFPALFRAFWMAAIVRLGGKPPVLDKEQNQASDKGGK